MSQLPQAKSAMFRCEKCGCVLIRVDSQRYGKWFECIRHLNTPERCSGTEETRSPREIEEGVHA